MNSPTERRSVSLDREAYGWIQAAAERLDETVRAAMERAIRLWVYVSAETEVQPTEVVKAAKLNRQVVSWEEQLADEELPLVSQSEAPPWLSLDWERSKHTSVKIGDDYFTELREEVDRQDRTSKECVEEAVQLWCVVRYLKREFYSSELEEIILNLADTLKEL